MAIIGRAKIHRLVAIANAETTTTSTSTRALVVAEDSVSKSITMTLRDPRRSRSTRILANRSAVFASSSGRSIMGHKSNPISLRLGQYGTATALVREPTIAGSSWRTSRSAKCILETLPRAAISKVVIERPAKLCRVSIYAAIRCDHRQKGSGHRSCARR